MNAGEHSRWPIVVGGCHRSGTSIVRRILNSHSRIHCGPEVPFFRDFFGEYREDPYAHLRFSAAARSLVEEEDLLEILGSGLVRLHERAARIAGKPRWADKAPENVVHVESWDRLLEGECHFLWVVRNPLDNLASMVERPFPLTLPAARDGRVDHYRRFTEGALDSLGARPDRTRVVVYEELVAAPGEVIDGLMAWLGEEPESVQLDPNSVAHQAGLEDPNVSATRGIHAESVGAWRRLLDDEDAAAIWADTKDVWRRVDPQLRWVTVP